ncbi:hypothetical protein C8J56DRAFT_1138212 [Mycena floridula]|nr:hypothetical protein C8J56DRAFT_1138212 [Mycena floridula]
MLQLRATPSVTKQSRLSAAIILVHPPALIRSPRGIRAQQYTTVIGPPVTVFAMSHNLLLRRAKTGSVTALLKIKELSLDTDPELLMKMHNVVFHHFKATLPATATEHDIATAADLAVAVPTFDAIFASISVLRQSLFQKTTSESIQYIVRHWSVLSDWLLFFIRRIIVPNISVRTDIEVKPSEMVCDVLSGLSNAAGDVALPLLFPGYVSIAIYLWMHSARSGDTITYIPDPIFTLERHDHLVNHSSEFLQCICMEEIPDAANLLLAEIRQGLQTAETQSDTLSSALVLLTIVDAMPHSTHCRSIDAFRRRFIAADAIPTLLNAMWRLLTFHPSLVADTHHAQ